MIQSFLPRVDPSAIFPAIFLFLTIACDSAASLILKPLQGAGFRDFSGVVKRRVGSPQLTKMTANIKSKAGRVQCGLPACLHLTTRPLLTGLLTGQKLPNQPFQNDLKRLTGPSFDRRAECMGPISKQFSSGRDGTATGARGRAPAERFRETDLGSENSQMGSLSSHQRSRAARWRIGNALDSEKMNSISLTRKAQQASDWRGFPRTPERDTKICENSASKLFPKIFVPEFAAWFLQLPPNAQQFVSRFCQPTDFANRLLTNMRAQKTRAAARALGKEFMTTDNFVSQSVVQAQQPEAYISKAEVARRLGKEVRTIDNWMRQGKIPYFKIGRSVNFKWSDVDSFMQAKFRVVQPASK